MSFVIGPDEGTSLGGRFDVRIKVRGSQTNAVMAVIEETLPPKAFITPHTHSNDVWVQVISGEIGLLVGDEIQRATAGSWALKPRSVVHAMWNAAAEPARIVEILTPAGTEEWFEHLSHLHHDDKDGFADLCRRYGISFIDDSPWTQKIRERFDL